MKIVLKKQYVLGKPVVAKLWFGDRYLIVKARDIKRSARELIDACLLSEAEAPREGLRRFVIPRVLKAIRRADQDGEKCIIEVLLATERAEELLAKEQVALNQRDRKALNANDIVDKPSWIFDYLVSRSAPASFFRMLGRHRAAPAVVKLLVDDKFFIWKCKDLHQFPAKFNESMETNILHDDPDRSGVLQPLVKYLVENPLATCLIEVVYKGQLTRAGVRKLLAAEKKLLDAHARRGRCLNRSKKSYTPEWVELILSPKSKVNANKTKK